MNPLKRKIALAGTMMAAAGSLAGMGASSASAMPAYTLSYAHHSAVYTTMDSCLSNKAGAEARVMNAGGHIYSVQMKGCEYTGSTITGANHVVNHYGYGAFSYTSPSNKAIIPGDTKAYTE